LFGFKLKPTVITASKWGLLQKYSKMTREKFLFVYTNLWHTVAHKKWDKKFKKVSLEVHKFWKRQTYVTGTFKYYVYATLFGNFQPLLSPPFEWPEKVKTIFCLSTNNNVIVDDDVAETDGKWSVLRKWKFESVRERLIDVIKTNTNNNNNNNNNNTSKKGLRY
jgi:hypothetical protein